MATLNTTFQISSPDTVDGLLTLDKSMSDRFSYSSTTSDTITVAHGAASVVVASAVATATYVYIKNTDATNFCDLKNDAGNVWGILHPGEFIFFCVNPSDGFEIQANTASCVVEYVTFLKS